MISSTNSSTNSLRVADALHLIKRALSSYQVVDLRCDVRWSASRGVTGTADPVAAAVDRPSGGDDVPRESARPAASVDEVRVEIPGSAPGGGGGRAGRRAPPRRTQSSDPVTPFAFMHEWTALKAAAGCRPYAALLARVQPTQLPKGETATTTPADGP